MDLTVQTKTGKVKGFETEGVNAWLGIPFAQPPVGELRFKRARPVDAWEGVKDCTAYGNDPVQCVGAIKREKESEDCLNLNVWSPKDAAQLPVLVWIYGGGLHYGYNSDLSYDGAAMAASGIVRVNINFRVGVFGYYNFNQFNAELFDTNCPMSDQITALRWIKENIAAFGGDPENITIAGESGGGMAVFHLLASPAAKGLFNKAIAQSGLPQLGGGRKFQSTIMPVFLDYLGLQAGEIEKVKTMETAVLQQASGKFFLEFTNKHAGIFMPSPVFGDDLLPERPWKALQNGSARGVDLIIGYNRDEGDTMIAGMEGGAATPWIPSWDAVAAMLKNNGKEQHYNELRAAYEQFGPERAALSALAKDYFFVLGSHRCAEAQTGHANVWMYRFDFVLTAYKYMNMGAVHSCEIPFALNTINKGYFGSRVLQGTPAEHSGAIRDQMNGAWLNFVKTGNPEGGNIAWKKYDMEHTMAHVFDLAPSNQPLSIDTKVLAAWEKIGLLYDEE